MEVRHNFMIFAAKVGLAFTLSCVPVCVLAAPEHANMGPNAKHAVVRTEGRPRFYRYRLEGDENSPVIAASLRADPLASKPMPDPAEDELATRTEPATLVSKEAVAVAPPSSLREDTLLIGEGRRKTRGAIAQALISYAVFCLKKKKN